MSKNVRGVTRVRTRTVSIVTPPSREGQGYQYSSWALRTTSTFENRWAGPREAKRRFNRPTPPTKHAPIRSAEDILYAIDLKYDADTWCDIDSIKDKHLTPDKATVCTGSNYDEHDDNHFQTYVIHRRATATPGMSDTYVELYDIFTGKMRLRKIPLFVL